MDKHIVIYILVIIVFVISENNKNYVLLEVSNKKNQYSFKKVAVSIGDRNSSFVALLSNNTINASSKILVKGAFDIAN